VPACEAPARAAPVSGRFSATVLTLTVDVHGSTRHDPSYANVYAGHMLSTVITMEDEVDRAAIEPRGYARAYVAHFPNVRVLCTHDTASH
jgi:hypothetical protein